MSDANGMSDSVHDFLRVSSLTKRYGDRDVVSSVSFSLPQGKFLSLLGPSGSGKTTVLRMLAGLVHPDDGLISIGGQLMYAPQHNVPPEERELGMVFQDFALWPHMTVAHNIAFGLRLRRISRDETQERVRDALGLVDLSGFEDRYPHQLSGGQQQRVALARALVTRPRLLLLDEPLSSLDTGLREAMREELLRIVRTTGATVVNVTHDQDEAMSISDQILLLRNGVVQQEGTPDDLYTSPHSTFVARFMGPANIMTGIVEDATGDTITLRTDSLTMQAARDMRHVRESKQASLLCRPEYALVREQAPTGEANTWRGTVTRSAFAGGRWRAQIELESGFNVTVFSLHAPVVGQSCYVTFPMEYCLLIATDDTDQTTALAPEREGVMIGVIG